MNRDAVPDAPKPLTVQRVVLLMLAAISEAHVMGLVALWLKRGIVEWSDSTETDLVWSEEQKQRGGTIRW